MAVDLFGQGAMPNHKLRRFSIASHVLASAPVFCTWGHRYPCQGTQLNKVTFALQCVITSRRLGVTEVSCASPNTDHRRIFDAALKFYGRCALFKDGEDISALRQPQVSDAVHLDLLLLYAMVQATRLSHLGV